MNSLILLPYAEADLKEIYDYTLSTWGEIQFHTYRQKLEAAFHALKSNPLLPGSRKRDDIFPGCRFLSLEHHFIVYRVNEGRVEIGRILHQKMHTEPRVTPDIFDPQ